MRSLSLAVLLFAGAELLAGCGAKPTSQKPPDQQPPQQARATPAAAQIVAGAALMQAGGLTLDATITSAPAGVANAGSKSLQAEQGVNR